MESGQSIAFFAENEPFRATKMWNELVRNFKTGVRLKKKRWRMKYYDDCFSGSDALAWIHEFLKFNPNFGQNVSRTQAKLLCQKLLQRNVFEDVLDQFKSAKPVFEESHLYSFIGKVGVFKEARARAASDLKENTEIKMVKNRGSTLKRHSSFSDRLQLTRKPLGNRNGLQNIPKEFENECSPKIVKNMPPQFSLRQSGSNGKAGLVLQNLGAVKTKQEHSHDHLRRKHSRKGMPGLTRKWKSEYNFSLMEKNEESDDENATETMNCDQHNEKLVRQGNKKTDQEESIDNTCRATASNDQEENQLNQGISIASHTDESENLCHAEPQGTSSENQVETTADNQKAECCQPTDPNQLWMTVCLERLQQALKVTTLNDILDVDLLSWENVLGNITSGLRNVTEAVPKWLVSAMKCLIHWPHNVDSRTVGCSGFENDVFKTIQEHFELLSEPLVTSNFIPVFTKISGIITKCKLSGIRTLQLTLLLLEKNKREQLQLLLRFMIKVSKNHQLNLSSHLPTRELVIQTFVPCIFGGKGDVNEILRIRITSFIMENYAEIFKVPDGLMFEVQQQIAFRSENGKNEGKPDDEIAFCLRVTKQEYEEQKKLGTQRFLEDLLDNIVHDKKLNEKERKKKLKRFQKTYPEIYFSRFPTDGLSIISQAAKLHRVMNPLTRRHVKNFR